MLYSNAADMHKNRKFLKHPCFNNYDFHNAIIHLPVAAESNIRCNYGLDDNCHDNHDNCHYDNPGAGSVLITPYMAASRYKEALEKIPNLTVAAIAGPGEPLACFEKVKETLKLVRQINPEVILCLSTNGLMLPVYANHLISLGINHVTVSVNTVNPDTGAKLYDHITYMGREYSGVEGANILLQNQIAGISYLSSMGVLVRLNTLVIKGVNDRELKDIAYMARETGCKYTNLIWQVPKSNEMLKEGNSISKDEIKELRKECEKIIPQSYYCKPCHAAGIETLNARLSVDFNNLENNADNNAICIAKGDTKGSAGSTAQMEGTEYTYRFAVCSKNGKLVDEHFGHASRFYIYDYKDGDIQFVEARATWQYCYGTREEKEAGRIYNLIRAIEDCHCVICLRIGICPSNALKEKNIDIYTTYNLIEDGIKEAVARLYTTPLI